MGATTGITWTDSTLNPWIGCQRVSPGCELCYAEVQDSRKRWGGEAHWGPKAPRYRTSRSTWNNALRWNNAAAKLSKRHLVFCASLADVFEDREELVPWRADLFALIRSTPALTWQLLTKRPENIVRLWPKEIHRWYTMSGGPTAERVMCPPPGAEAWPNIWMGTTVEDQRRADERLPVLLSVPAALHWVSAEPLLQTVAMAQWMGPGLVEWVIAGGESDVGATAEARPFDLAWARLLALQCDVARVPFFMKQKGSNVFDAGLEISCLGKGDEPAEWPPGLQRQEFPKARAA